MLNRFRLWLRSRVALRRLTVAQRMADGWTANSAKLSWLLERDSRKLSELHELVQKAVEDHREHLDLAQRHLRQSEVVVEALRSENKILGDVEVPLLNTVNQHQLERYKALVAVEVMRQVAASTKGEV